MNSVVSYPDRGPWGDARWRGNTSGYIIKDLIEHFRPQLFLDVCEGSGTSRDVCRDLGVEYVGLDLHMGVDFTRDYILSHLPRPADIAFSHPPYADIIPYSGNVWATSPVPGDTSHCTTIEEFLEKSQVMLQNQREATREGGHYVTLVGDIRQRGVFRSLQADFIDLMPKEELVSVVIKLQHNVRSAAKRYGGRFIPILHEYMLVWQKSAMSLFAVSWEMAVQKQQQLAATWRTAIRIALMRLGGQASLDLIYNEVKKVAGHLIAKNPSWKAKIRQQLQYHFHHVERGVWGVAA